MICDSIIKDNQQKSTAQHFIIHHKSIARTKSLILYEVLFKPPIIDIEKVHIKYII